MFILKERKLENKRSYISQNIEKNMQAKYAMEWNEQK
jgi:hypothetical protein